MKPSDIEKIPDGALVEMVIRGRLRRMASGSTMLRDIEDPNRWTHLSDGDGYAHSALLMATAIEVLPEPVIEPTKEHAVVFDSYRYQWVRDRGGVWWRAGEANGKDWYDLIKTYGPLTVVFEGVDDD